MLGIRIGKIHVGGGTGDPSFLERSDFSLIFQPLKPAFDQYHWLFVGTGFSFPSDWYIDLDSRTNEDCTPEAIELDKLILGRNGRQVLYTKPQFMNRVMDCMVSGWNSIYGFKNPGSDTARFSDYQYKAKSETESKRLLHEADLILFNSAGVYWEMFSKDEPQMEQVWNHLVQAKIVKEGYTYVPRGRVEFDAETA